MRVPEPTGASSTKLIESRCIAWTPGMLGSSASSELNWMIATCARLSVVAI